MSKISLIIIEDHTILRESLVERLQAVDGFSVEAHFSTAEEALQFLTRKSVDVALTDYGLPGINGLVFSKRAQEITPKLRIVMLSMHNKPEIVRSAMNDGISAYIPKDSTTDELIFAIRIVHRGEAFLSPRLTKALLESYVRAPGEKIDQDLLSAEQVSLLRMACRGMGTKEMAGVLCLPEHTVKHRFAAIFKALKVKDKTQAVFKAIQLGLLTTKECL
jgi:DNA-binding NarL/FixJ family response regulator